MSTLFDFTLWFVLQSPHAPTLVVLVKKGELTCICFVVQCVGVKSSCAFVYTISRLPFTASYLVGS